MRRIGFRGARGGAETSRGHLLKVRPTGLANGLGVGYWVLGKGGRGRKDGG